MLKNEYKNMIYVEILEISMVSIITLLNEDLEKHLQYQHDVAKLRMYRSRTMNVVQFQRLWKTQVLNTYL
ncbi:hypothetical protein PIPA1_23460 [Pelosinus sp. IPA-1]|nr:hypothetical protein PIPA1_23460 [Pelosinus sp. IPA-1]